MGLFLLGSYGALASSAPGPQVQASPSVQASSPAQATPSPAPVTGEEALSLRREFSRAQVSEFAALKHQQSLEFRELQASQTARRRAFEATERDARRQYFQANPEGPKRRAYVQQLMERRRGLVGILSDEMSRRKKEQASARESLQFDQAQKRKEFQESLSRGVRPSAELWPRS